MSILSHPWGPESLIIPKDTTWEGGIPVPSAEWSEIVPGLYQGGVINQMSTTEGFDVVVSLIPYDLDDWLQCHDGGERIDIPMFDSPDLANADELRDIASIIADCVGQGQRVLVRCEAGLNRSGLVVALALMAMGMDARSSIDLIREKRSKWALCNRAFHDWLVGQ